MVVVDRFSMCACYLSMAFGSQNLAHGTGFLYTFHGRMFLVTARHNLTGTHWQSGKNLSPHGGRPSHLTIYGWLDARIGEDSYVSSGNFKITLYSDGNPIWMEAKKRPTPDVAVIDLQKVAIKPELLELEDDRAQFCELFESGRDFSKFFQIASLSADVKVPHVNEGNTDYRLSVGQDLFIVGYPLKFAEAGQFPIWKKGSIATEPFELYDGHSLFLIDAVTREGLSGAPIIGEFVNPSFDNGGKGVLTKIGTDKAFAGIYTGRIGNTDDFSAQMGLVWRPSVIDEIIADNWRE